MFPPDPLPAAEAWPRPSRAVTRYAPSGHGAAEAGLAAGADVDGAADGAGAEARDEHPAARSATAVTASTRTDTHGHHGPSTTRPVGQRMRPA